MLLTGAGLACIYAGYRLFCGLPSAVHSGSRARLLLLNVLPGAVLAIVGMAVIAMQARTLVEPHRVVRQRQVPASGDSPSRLSSWPGDSLQTRRPADT